MRSGSERDARDNALIRKLRGRTVTERSHGYLASSTSGGGNDLPPVNPGMVNPMLALWSLIRGGQGGAPVEFPAGAEGEVLTMQGDGSFAWETPASGTGGSYRQYVVIPDGLDGFEFVDDGAGNPVYSLEVLE